MDYETIRTWDLPEVVHAYDRKDTILYALGIGYGFDPLDERQLAFVYEEGLVAAPSMAAVLGHPGFWMRQPDTGIDWVKVLHAEQTLTLCAPLPVEGEVVGRTRVTAIVDKGPDRGALVYQERTVTDRRTGTLLATVEPTMFCRGDGGLARSDDPPAPLPAPPETEPDRVCDLPTLPQAALVYRLSGDANPLHALPRVAAEAGFDRPILHGLATFGVVGHALLRTYGDYDPSSLRRIGVRFSAPVYPGETIRTEMWQVPDGIRFRARSLDRDVVVLTNGFAQVGS